MGTPAILDLVPPEVGVLYEVVDSADRREIENRVLFGPTSPARWAPP